MEPVLDQPRSDPAPAGSTRRGRWRTGGRTFGWVVTVALIATMGSERIYWYWGGIGVLSATELALFYAVAAGTALLALAWRGGRTWRGVLAAGALFALVVEGVITPVVYEDGPFPVLFFLFIFWHGTLAFAGLVFLIRRWLLERRTARLTVAAVLLGAYWGAWALISAVVDRDTAELIAAEGGGSADILEPAAFAVYASWVGAILIGGHWVLGWLWPAEGWRPSRRGAMVLALLVAAIAALMVIPAVPWAPLKFVLLGWPCWSILRRDGAASAAPVTPTVIDRLRGHVRPRDLAPLLAVPAVAGGVYAALWPLRDAAAMPAIFWTLTAQQVIVGATVAVWCLAPRRVRSRAGRRRMRSVGAESSTY